MTFAMPVEAHLLKRYNIFSSGRRRIIGELKFICQFKADIGYNCSLNLSDFIQIVSLQEISRHPIAAQLPREHGNGDKTINLKSVLGQEFVGSQRP
jgi:hypothetical protein